MQTTYNVNMSGIYGINVENINVVKKFGLNL